MAKPGKTDTINAIAGMAYTEQQLALLEEAISQGVLEMIHDGKKIVYRSLAEMKQLRDDMKKELGKLNNSPTRRYLTTSRGTRRD